MKQILPNIHQLSLNGVNAYLIDHGGLTLIDTGYAGNGQKILNYIRKMGKTAKDLENIILTHLHTDHTGSLAEIKAQTNARIIMSAADAACVEKGVSFRNRIEISPGVLQKLVFLLFVKNAPRNIEPVEVNHYLQAGEEKLTIGRGFQLIPVPGHAKGQLALLYQEHGGVLFAADTCGNMFGLGPAPFYEDYKQGCKDLQTLAQYSFEHMTFGHGKPIIGGASSRFKKRFMREKEYRKREVPV